MQEASLFLAPLRISSEVRAAFIERIPGTPTSTDKNVALTSLQPAHLKASQDLGFSHTYHAEQVHADSISLITSHSPRNSIGADALITTEKNLLLGIHVADCGALYLLDRRRKALGLLHSGKKGSEKNITAKTITAMTTHFGTKPSDLTAVLAPCIRPPYYEVDFAQTIRSQALSAGILPEHYHDCGLCTASDLTRFYSYRIEKGNTGRHLALLGLHSS